MADKLPVVSGKNLVKLMSSLGYVVVRQRGSHIRLELETPVGTHKITVPNHREISKGTLGDILGKVSLWTQIDKKTLIEKLSRV